MLSIPHLRHPSLATDGADNEKNTTTPLTSTHELRGNPHSQLMDRGKNLVS